MDTCDRCHRQRGVPSLFDRNPSVCAYTDGLAWDSVAGVDCAAARDRYLVAEVARLTAELAEARKPRWVAVGDVRVLVSAGRRLGAVKYRGHGPEWAVSEDGNWRNGYATEAEAKKAAEDACGVAPKAANSWPACPQCGRTERRGDVDDTDNNDYCERAYGAKSAVAEWLASDCAAAAERRAAWR